MNIIDFESARLRADDHMVRGTAAYGMVRAFAISARRTVQTAHENHDTAAVVTAALGRLMMAGLMMGSMFKQPVEFYCGCDEERAARATAALGADELRDMVQKGETAEVYCHFCGKRHYLPIERLRELLGEERQA